MPITKEKLDSWYTPRDLKKVSTDYLEGDEEPCWACGKEICVCDRDYREMKDLELTF